MSSNLFLTMTMGSMNLKNRIIMAPVICNRAPKRRVTAITLGTN